MRRCPLARRGLREGSERSNLGMPIAQHTPTVWQRPFLEGPRR